MGPESTVPPPPVPGGAACTMRVEGPLVCVTCVDENGRTVRNDCFDRGGDPNGAACSENREPDGTVCLLCKDGNGNIIRRGCHTPPSGCRPRSRARRARARPGVPGHGDQRPQVHRVPDPMGNEIRRACQPEPRPTRSPARRRATPTASPASSAPTRAATSSSAAARGRPPSRPSPRWSPAGPRGERRPLHHLRRRPGRGGEAGLLRADPAQPHDPPEHAMPGPAITCHTFQNAASTCTICVDAGGKVVKQDCQPPPATR